MCDDFYIGGGPINQPKRTYKGPEIFQQMFGMDERNKNAKSISKSIAGAMSRTIYEIIMHFVGYNLYLQLKSGNNKKREMKESDPPVTAQ